MLKAFCKTVVLAALLLGGAGHAYGAQKPLDEAVALEAWQLLHNMEVQHNIPQGLLHAISLVETGGGLGGQMVPWPYAVNVNVSKWHKGVPDAALLDLQYLESLGFKTFSLKGSNGQRVDSLNKAEAKTWLQNRQADQPIMLRGAGFSQRFSNKWKAIFFVNRLLVAGHDNIDIGLMQVNWMYHGRAFTDLAEAFDPYHNVQYAVSYLMQHRQQRDWWASVGRYHSKTKKHADRYIQNVWAMYQKVHRLGGRGQG